MPFIFFIFIILIKFLDLPKSNMRQFATQAEESLFKNGVPEFESHYEQRVVVVHTRQFGIVLVEHL